MALPTWFVFLVAGTTLTILIASAIRRFGPPEADASAGRMDWPELGLQGRVDGACPVLGEGTIGTYSFAFFAQNDSWTFDVTEGHLDPWNFPGIGSACHYEGEAIGSSYMPIAEAQEIIRDCARKFLDHD